VWPRDRPPFHDGTHSARESIRNVKMDRFRFPALSGPALFDSAARLLTVAFSLAAIFLAGRWLTELTAPRPVAELPSAPMAQPVTATGTVSRLFGSGNIESQTLEGMYLTGVFAGSRGGGFATIRTRTGDVHVFPGEEVAPGVILKQMERNRVILLSSGIEKELTLRESPVPPAASSLQTITNRPPQPVRAEQE